MSNPMSHNNSLREEIAKNFMQCMADVIDGDSSNESAYAYTDNVVALLALHTERAVREAWETAGLNEREIAFYEGRIKEDESFKNRFLSPTPRWLKQRIIRYTNKRDELDAVRQAQLTPPKEEK